VPAVACGCISSEPGTIKNTGMLEVARTDRDFNNAPDNFQFVILSDRTGGCRPGVFAEAVSKTNVLQPEFVMCVGDLIEGYTETTDQLDEQWEEFDKIANGLEMPFFYVPGNHDISNQVMTDYWNRRYGPSYYHFVYRNVLFLCLNTEDPPGTGFSEEQIRYVADALEQNPGVRWTFVFMHRPMWLEGREGGWEQVEKLLDGRGCTVFAGHYHNYVKYERLGHSYFILATTGGGSSLTGPDFGEFDHIVWVTMTADGPSIANLMLDGIAGENIRTEESAALVSSLIQGWGISTDAVFVEGVDFKAADSVVRLANVADVSMSFRMAFRPNTAISPDPIRREMIVPAKSSETLKIKLDAPTPVKIDHAPPLVFDWTAKCELPGREEPVTVKGESRVVLDRIFICPRRKEPVKIDGKLDEWKELPVICSTPGQIQFNPESWGGPKDGSFRFAAEYDDKFLYIAVEATDDKLVAVPTSWPWFQDGIEVRLDARPDPERSKGRGEGEKESFLLLALSPGDTPENMVFCDQDILPKGTRAVSLKTNTGHATEMAIPMAYLNEKQGAKWKGFRLNVAVDDFDGEVQDRDDAAQIWWRPDWRTPASYSGSGTFKRK